MKVPNDFEGDNFGEVKITKGTDDDGSNVGLIVGVVFAVVVFIAAVCAGVFFYRRKRKFD